MSGTALKFIRDSNGQVVCWERDLVAAVDTFALPFCWPYDPDECKTWLFDYATVSGAAMALGYGTVDVAYLWVRGACQSAQDSTMNKVRVVHVFPFCAHLIDEAHARVTIYLDLSDASAFRELRRIAIVAILSGRPEIDVRQRLVDAAAKISPLPPEALLHEVLASSIAECRRNTRWMSSRKIQA